MLKQYNNSRTVIIERKKETMHLHVCRFLIFQMENEATEESFMVKKTILLILLKQNKPYFSVTKLKTGLFLLVREKLMFFRYIAFTGQ